MGLKIEDAPSLSLGAISDKGSGVVNSAPCISQLEFWRLGTRETSLNECKHPFFVVIEFHSQFTLAVLNRAVSKSLIV